MRKVVARMKEWQFNVLFCVAVGGTIFLLIAPAVPWFHDVPDSPTAVGGIGVILAYVLQQKNSIARRQGDEGKAKPETEKVDDDA